MAEQRLGTAIDLAGRKLSLEIDAFVGGFEDQSDTVLLTMFCAISNKDQLTEQHA